MKKRLKSAIAVALALAVMVVTAFTAHQQIVELPEVDVPLASGSSGFVKAEGTVFTDEDGKEFLIRAMGFGNACWSNHETPTYPHHSEADYARLKELGFNAVRYYLNYGIFEDDSAPYVYKQEAWDWLDQNVEWAKKHGIKIIFNMHYPQGGFQSAGNGMNLWLNHNDEQGRLTALWKAIAHRYADEETVLGYGLVNEPYMPWLWGTEATVAQWDNLAQRLTDAIREVDKNHVIFVEAIFAAKDIYTGQIYQQLNSNKNLVQVEDSCNNVAYEIHYYNPSEFTHMQEDAPVSYLNYPNDNVAITSGEQWLGSTYNEVLPASTPKATGEWQKVETKLYSVSNQNADVFYMALAANYLNGKTAYFDDASIDLYDAKGNFVSNIVKFDFSTEQQWYNYYSADGSGAASYVTTEGHNGKGCVAISGSQFFASVGKSVPINVKVKEGYQYKLSVWVKAEGTQDAILYPQFSLCKGVDTKPYTESYLQDMIRQYKKVTDSWNAPLFLGEFGVLEETYNGHGGQQWMEDMIHACADQSVGFSIHLYHMEGFGLYTNSQYLKPADENEILRDTILKAVKPLEQKK